MRLVVHILKKDLRHHWPEILIALVLLGLYVWTILPGAIPRYSNLRFLWFQWGPESAATVLLLFWVFLTVRVVQGETLVGDRQWWVTKPYDWRTLLAAKELFVLLCLGLPLFLVQMYLLHQAGFSILHNLWGILYMQGELALILILPSVALGALSKNLGQAFLGVMLLLVGTWAAVTVLNNPTGAEMSVNDFGDIFGVLSLAIIVVAIHWQYSRRRTWPPRFLVGGGAALLIIIAALIPNTKGVDKKYPFVDDREQPVHFAVALPTADTKTGTDGLDLRLPYSYLTVPVLASGIATDHVVLLDGARIMLQTSNGTSWDSGWKSAWSQLWQETDHQNLSFVMPQQDFDKFKNQSIRLHLELALTEFRAKEARALILHDGEFTDALLGICRWNENASLQIRCRRPFHQQGFIATFDSQKSPCQSGEDFRGNPVLHAWSPPRSDDSPDVGFNPVDHYIVQLDNHTSSYTEGGTEQKIPRPCAGSAISLASPEELQHIRVGLDVGNANIQNLIAPLHPYLLRNRNEPAEGQNHSQLTPVRRCVLLAPPCRRPGLPLRPA
jgi:hypothetical protein